MANEILKIARLQDADIKGKNVVVRVDYNVPIKDGKVENDKRIAATVPTVKYLLENGCRVVLMSHLGRPKGKVAPEFSLAPTVPVIEKLMGAKVHFAKDCIGPEAENVVNAAQKGELVLLENLRFHPEEEKNDKAFARQLASYGEFFVQDAFGTVHRAHASTAAIAEFLPGAAGFLVQKELEYLDRTIRNPQRPFLAIIGGAKVSDKIMVLNNLLGVVDMLIIGGGMAYTFLQAQNVAIGKSLVEPDKVGEAKDIIAKSYSKHVECLLPADHVIVQEVKPDAPSQITQAMAIPDGWAGVDIGPRTTALFIERIKKARTIFWNGPLGIFEMDAFANGSVSIAKALAEATKTGATTIVGGGDSLSVLKKAGVKASELTHCSTGGGASMEFLEGKTLPGLAALSKSASLPAQKH
ncbi:MAG: phosphoglycerate kinase [Elusimicrobiales bacterium]|nr:phosphoglycerate kinase [Elusimicrobiales bacterium]